MHSYIVNLGFWLRMVADRGWLSIFFTCVSRPALPRVLVPAVIALLVSACSTSSRPTVEVGPEGPVNITEQREVDPAALRDRMQRDMLRGLSGYRLVSGDVLEVLYLSSSRPQPIEYVLGVGDRLRVEFHYTNEAPRTLLIRPDGRVTLPLKGEVLAAGRTARQLTRALEALYSDIFVEPRISVSVEQYTSKIEDLRVSLTNLQRGRSQRATIAPDGSVYLPYLSSIRVAGMTQDEARDAINAEYAKAFSNLEVSVLLEAATGNRVFVFGEVARPGVVQLVGPMTAMQALASAGGHLPTGSLADVRVLYWRPGETEPRLRSINIARVLSDRRVDEDLVLPPNSTIYVPPTGITQANRAVDQFLRQLFLFNGVGIGFQRQL